LGSHSLTVCARPRDRDPIEQRIIQAALEGRGKIIDSQQEVGGTPTAPPPASPSSPNNAAETMKPLPFGSAHQRPKCNLGTSGTSGTSGKRAEIGRTNELRFHVSNGAA
jgi:hypothetical protein